MSSDSAAIVQKEAEVSEALSDIGLTKEIVGRSRFAEKTP